MYCSQLNRKFTFDMNVLSFCSSANQVPDLRIMESRSYSQVVSQPSNMQRINFSEEEFPNLPKRKRSSSSNVSDMNESSTSKNVFSKPATKSKKNQNGNERDILGSFIKTRVEDGSKMAGMDVMINKVLPTEMLKTILERLDYKSLCFARQICMRWKEIINGFDLVEKAFSKHLEFLIIFNIANICGYFVFLFQKGPPALL